MDEQIDVITESATAYAYENYARQMEILLSVPGIGKIGAITLLAEIGDVRLGHNPMNFAKELQSGADFF